jgi:hypothetical protein
LGEIEGLRGDGGWRIGAKSGRVRKSFEMIDFSGGDVDERLIAVDIEACDGADDLAALVEDGESVAKHGGIGGEGGGRGEESEEDELEKVSHCNVRLTSAAKKPVSE